jgi:ufm1-conjugating enzyme 1
MAGVDDATKATVQKLPMLSVKAGPRDGEDWIKRMKEEYMALIQVRARRRSEDAALLRVSCARRAALVARSTKR